MGWNGGGDLIVYAWSRIRKMVPEEKRAEGLAALISACENEDWDQADEIEDQWEESRDALTLCGYVEEYDERREG